MKIKSETDILDPEIRKTIISEITGPENQSRKAEALKRYEIYKDLTRKYVIESLGKELELDTVQEMVNRAANISICKKIINKKARVYRQGAIRELITEDKKGIFRKVKKFFTGGDAKAEEEQAKIDEIYKLLKGNQNMKKANRYLELQKNTAVQIVPLQDENGEWYLKMRVLLGHTYDAVEDNSDPEKALVYILSHFLERDQSSNVDIEGGGDGRGAGHRPSGGFRQGDSKDQLIADSEADQGEDMQRFTWWSKSFHFTTNGAGQYIDPKTDEVILEDASIEEIMQDDRIINSIQMQSIVSLNKDQDGNYWAVGGEDLTDGAILINVQLTDLYFIAKVQGMGIFFVTGPNIPKTYKVGPNRGITINTEGQEGPPPTIGFATSNPPIEAHMRMIEQYIALLLSTNDLAASTVQGRLDATNAASGIADLIVKSEVTGAIEDEQQIFNDVEPEIFKVIKAWQNNLVEQNLDMREDFKDIGSFDEKTKIRVKFLPFQEFLTEEQKLKIIELRRELGLDTMVDSLIRDNADLTKEQAEQKLLEILKDKIEQSSLLLMEESDGDDKDGDDSEKDREGSVQKDEEEEDKEAENSDSSKQGKKSRGKDS